MLSFESFLARGSHHAHLTFTSFLSRHAVQSREATLPSVSLEAPETGQAKQTGEAPLSLVPVAGRDARGASGSREAWESFLSRSPNISRPARSVGGAPKPGGTLGALRAGPSLITLISWVSFLAISPLSTNLGVGDTGLSLLAFNSGVTVWPKGVKTWSARQTLVSFEAIKSRNSFLARKTWLSRVTL